MHAPNHDIKPRLNHCFIDHRVGHFGARWHVGLMLERTAVVCDARPASLDHFPLLWRLVRVTLSNCSTIIYEDCEYLKREL